MRLTLPAVLLLLALPALADDPSPRVDALVAEIVAPDTPGAAVLVVSHGRTVHLKGYGLASVEHKVPITKDTVFDLASVSKQFTALAIMLLADSGELTFEDDVREHVPELPEWSEDRPIRLADMLHHTSGLPDYLGMLGEMEGDPNRLKNADVPKLLAKKKLDFPTGTKWAYSNTNYLLLSLVVERVTKKSLGRFLKEEVFKPLGMPNATVFESPTAVIPHRASGYGGKGRKLRVLHSDLTVTGDGGVMLSLADFEKWIGAIRGKKLAEEKTWDLAMTPGRLDDGKPHSYGFGWLIGKEGGRLVIGHSGSWVGVASDVSWYVEEDLFVVVLTNWNPGVNPTELGRKVAAEWLESEK